MLCTGLTGGIGSGKSVISEIFQTFGFPVYNADREAKRFLFCDDVMRIFAPAMPATSKEIAAIVFSDTEKMNTLNAIIHPLVMADFKQWIALQTAPCVFMESAVIYEANLQHYFDKIIFVDSPKELRIERVINRSALSREEILQRMSVQISSQEALSRADFVIRNDESISLLEQAQEFCLKFL
ncbi:MAG: dephospho-CoA kinase [Bacteroidales bacterium]|nr:dephospho-CoA kinase [Bacteroidales bacterium]